jgi:hypothetical protein
MMNTMKTLRITLGFLLCGFLLNAQNLDKIIGKHLDAHGGEKNIAAITSLKIEGKFTAFSIIEDYTAYKNKEGAYYADLFLGKHKVFEAFDGKKGWTDDPWQELDFPRYLNRNEVNVMQQKAVMVTPFYQYKEKGCKAELLGEKDVEGTPAYAIKLIRPDGLAEVWYLNKETFLACKSESQWVDFAYPAQSEAYYDDYRKVKGVFFLFMLNELSAYVIGFWRSKMWR